MKGKLSLSLLGGLSLFSSSSVFAHISPSGEGVMGVLLHPFTGLDHLPMLIFIGIGIAYLIRKQREQDD
jgi:hydrogenase/urease accessory protein HupE